MKFFDGIDFTETPAAPSRPSVRYAPAAGDALPAVSVVTPFYNTGTVFLETLHCVLQQTLQQWEWLVINDGSDDPRSLELLEQLRERRDSRIRVIDHDVNRGLSAARNTGVGHACAPLVCFLDSDDLIEATTLEKLAWSLSTRPSSSFVSSYTVGFGAQQYLWSRGFHEGRAFLTENLVTANCMVRRELFGEVGGFDEERRQGLEDWDFWLRCAVAGRWGHTVTEYLEWYRRRATHNDRWDDFGAKGIAEFRRQASLRYSQLKKARFAPGSGDDTVPRQSLPFANRLLKERRRVLFILPWLMMGGADHFNLTLVRELTARGSEVTIACTVPGDDSWCHEFARYTCDIFMLPRFLQLHDYPRFLRYLIESRQPDFVVLSNSELGYLLLPYLRSYCPGPVYLDYSHMEEPEWRQGGFPALSVQFGAHLDGSMVASHYLKRWMVEQGGDPGLIQVCHINVDTQKWRPDPELRCITRCELGITENTAVILYAARLCRQKLPLFFAEVMGALAQRSPIPFVALVVGDGEDRSDLERYLRKHGLGDRIRVLGRVPIQRMPGMMVSADIFLLPSQNEGISLAIYEAMASGTTVVAADVGGQRELLVPGTGFLLPAGGDVEARERYVEVLMPLLEDLEERRRVGAQACRRVKEKFNIEQMVENFERICAHAAANRRVLVLPEDPDDVAVKAVQYVRAFGIGQKTLQLDGLPIKTRLYAATARYLGQIYYWCLAHRMGWVIGLKDSFRRAMGVDKG